MNVGLNAQMPPPALPLTGLLLRGGTAFSTSCFPSNHTAAPSPRHGVVFSKSLYTSKGK